MEISQKLFNRLSLIIWALILLSVTPSLVYLITGNLVIIDTREPVWLIVFLLSLSMIYYASNKELGYLIIAFLLINIGLLIRVDLLLIEYSSLSDFQIPLSSIGIGQGANIIMTLLFLGAVSTEHINDNLILKRKKHILIGLGIFTVFTVVTRLIPDEWANSNLKIGTNIAGILEIGALFGLLAGTVIFLPRGLQKVDNLFSKSILLSFLPMIVAQIHSLSFHLGYPGKHLLAEYYIRLISFVVWTTGLLLETIMAKSSDTNLIQMLNQNRNNYIKKMQELDSVFMCVEEGIVITNNTGTIIEVNPVMEKLLGINNNSAFSKAVLPKVVPLFDLNGNALPLSESPMIKAVLFNKTVIRQPLQLKQGEDTIDVLATASPIKDEQGQIKGSITAFKNISEIKKLHRAKNEFIATISHELRTPLSSVIGYIDLVIDEEAGKINAEQKEFLQVSLQNALNLKRLIDNLLDMESIESGHLALVKEPIFLSDVINDEILLFKTKAEEKGLSFIYDIESNIRVIGDRRRLGQVIDHLLTNALNYTKSGTIEFRVSTHRNQAKINVKDTGVGMSNVELESLFDTLTRSDDDYVRSIRGTGLGLPIIKALIELHHGSIEVKSEKNVGSEFIVFLPMFKN
ncbi:PAS domain-containing protein [bacterium]|nr:PAS domain-containing protein [bacterium]